MTRLRPAPSAVVLLLVAGAVWGGLTWHVKDLFVYRYAGRAVLDGLSPYAADDPVTGLPFTYPPVAAVLLVPFALAPAPAVAVGWTALSLCCLVSVVLLVRRHAGHATRLAGAACLAAAALLFEPVWQNLTFGQVNLVLMLVILVDLTNTHRRWSGVLLGIAAAVKLTPLVLVALLLLAGRRAVAARALASFVAAVGVGFLLLPRSSAAYWTDGLLDPGRVGPPALAHNQSVSGALTRLLDGTPPRLLWLVVAGAVATAVVLVAAAWWRRGDPVLAICLGAVAMLVASPVSWSHHWVWAVPVALVLWEHSRPVAVAWTAVFVLRPTLWPPWGAGQEYGWSAWEHLLGNSYLLAALLVAGWAWRRYVADLADAAGAAGNRERLGSVVVPGGHHEHHQPAPRGRARGRRARPHRLR